MRDIKFRCWFDNKMFRIVDIDFAYKKINLSGADIIDFNEGVLMQYTGLKDKNGKEIYEGDILPFTMHNGKVENYYIVFRDGEYEAINKDDTNFICIDLWKTSEVIGNIYEKPELLKEAKDEI